MYNEETPRRTFFKKSVTSTLALSAGVPLMASLLQSFITEAGIVPSSSDSPMAATEKEFRQGVIGPAELSLVTSQIAVSKATQKNAKELLALNWKRLKR